MTFEYELLLKRIIHVNAITRRIKDYLYNPPVPTYTPVDVEQARAILIHEKEARVASTNPLLARMAMVNEELRQLKLKEELQSRVIDPLTSIRQEVRNRLHKLDTGFDGE
jgi:hypothetical protein